MIPLSSAVAFVAAFVCVLLARRVEFYHRPEIVARPLDSFFGGPGRTVDHTKTFVAKTALACAGICLSVAAGYLAGVWP